MSLQTFSARQSDPWRTDAADGAAAPSRRDLRIDFFRGAALVFILWNHVFSVTGRYLPAYLQFTPLHWGLASAAEAFVFLSGFVYGAVYTRVLNRHGPLAVFVKSGVRAWQLYVANALAMLFALAAVSLWNTHGPGATPRVTRLIGIDPLSNPSPALFWDLARLHTIPWGFDVLALYIVLLVIGAFYIVLNRKAALLMLVPALLLYVTAQFGVNIPSAHVGRDTWFFNPFAWQMLFAIGILCGTGKVRLPRQPWLVVAAAALVALVAVQVWVFPRLMPRLPEAAVPMFRQLRIHFPLTDTTNLEFVRLGYFLILVFLVASLTKATGDFWAGRLARPLVRLGQHSLEVFCFGLVFTYVAALAITSLRWDWQATAFIGVLGCALSVGFAYLLHARRHSAWFRPGS